MKKIYLVFERTLKSVGLDNRIDIPQWLQALREESCVKNWRHWRLNNCQVILLFHLAFRYLEGWVVPKMKH